MSKLRSSSAAGLGTSIALLLLALLPTISAAATSVGQVDPSPGGMCTALTYVQDIVAPGTPGYSTPQGVITSWSSNIGPNPTVDKLKVFRRTTDPDKFLVAATDGPRTMQLNGLNTFPVRIPVDAGDLLGLTIVGTGASCLYGNSPSMIKCFSPEPDAGTIATTDTCQDAYQINVAATVEADADRDGFGDESQDKCATDALVQGACPDKTKPIASLTGSTSQNFVKQKAVIVTAQANEAGSLAATGTLTVPGASKAYKLVPASAAVSANSQVKLVLKISNKVRRKIRKALRKRRKVRATVGVTARDAVGNLGAPIKRTIKAKAIKRKKRH